ncbi:MAG: radical SAM protein [Mariprofundaceae bacterium]
MLTTDNHDRDAAGYQYIYPVVSRRAGGLSIGINLNPNNACNWHCLYCQVPNLTRGTAPTIDLTRLQYELHSLLNQVIHGDFLEKNLPESSRQLRDIAISGNGEPTSCRQFATICELICDIRTSFKLSQPITLITNGSYLHRESVQQGLKILASHQGQVWVKMDTANNAMIQKINGIKTTVDKLQQQIAIAASLCPTRIQTCLFMLDGSPPPTTDCNRYLQCLQQMKTQGITIQEVMLYGIERPSMQPEASRISKVPKAWLQSFADQISELGYHVSVNP